MEQKEYTRKDGTIGYEYRFLEGDKVRVLYPKAKEIEIKTKKGKNFKKYTLLVTLDTKAPIEQIAEDTKRYVTLTGTQAKKIEKLQLEMGDIIETYTYDNDHGDGYISIKKA